MLTSVRSYHGEPVKLLVGAEPVIFYVHEEVLTRSSIFLRTALKDKWEEGQSRQIKVPAEDPVVFHDYVHWLYHAKIHCPSVDAETCYSPMLLLYILADNLLDTACQDRVVDALLLHMRDKAPDPGDPGASPTRWFPIGFDVDLVYENTPKGSFLRRLMLDTHLYQGTSNWIRNPELASLNVESLADLSAGLLDKVYRVHAGAVLDKPEQFDAQSPCVYHKHGADKRCGADKQVAEKGKDAPDQDQDM
ncbi:hypothetical protein BAUCODRAFT_204625 [Baudoinia panamericana UAMH 10762]|uniref:BTB domain-containing protein n=1 Tax=Baudoinia panamericana (strain UAMH 10762) TaxID=717646 RepID=M2NP06_BAUPA|nr:uncharacterized protein BAUCODRAFT_204625 [Baudoinia panamericana UAMH 10762]EMD01280.1 hypothetical protein BAUCODRAFT_204625 [Baudoinia panamericana UAMH 10762]